MTGPEHYQEAESLLALASIEAENLSAEELDAIGGRTTVELIAAAQVHAGLAQAAATVAPSHAVSNDWGGVAY